jgi:hypothetical protein
MFWKKAVTYLLSLGILIYLIIFISGRTGMITPAEEVEMYKKGLAVPFGSALGWLYVGLFPHNRTAKIVVCTVLLGLEAAVLFFW